MISHLYRFRSVKQLLDGFNELEAQQLYFCPPGDLNDPVEGFKDLFWLGDGIVWRNLLKHYILSMVQVAPLCFTGEPDGGRSHLQNIVFAIPDDLPQAPVRELYAGAVASFLGEAAVMKFVELMAARAKPIRRNELRNYLRSLHPFALQAVFREFSARDVPLPEFMRDVTAEDLRKNAMKMMESAAQLPGMKDADDKKAEAFFSANEFMVTQLDLISEYQMKDLAATRPLAFFCRYFPGAYVDALDKLVHPDWYVACFSANPVNASMWGVYGDGHRGACLKFKATANSAGVPSLSLNRVTGLGGTKDNHVYSRSFVPTPLHKVEYAPAYPAIDFFRSLGSVSQMKLNHFWYLGDNGAFSSCQRTAFQDDAARAEYWKTFETSALFKTAEWAHEEEYRLVLHSGFDLREKPMRTLEYKFEDLSGIVFGARTVIEDKLKMMRIIDAKCAKERRSDFEFFEVRYHPEDSTFWLAPLSLLKIKYS